MTAAILPANVALPPPPSDPTQLAAWAKNMQQATASMYRMIARRAEDMIQSDVIASLPTASGSRRFFYATDTFELYFDAGTWQLVAPSAGAATGNLPGFENAVLNIQGMNINELDIEGPLQLGQTNLTLANGLNSDIAIGVSPRQRVIGPTAPFSIGGMVKSTLGFGSGAQFIMLYNTTAQPMTIINEDASSTAANRIKTPGAGALTLPPSIGAVMLTYVGAATRWYVVATNEPSALFASLLSATTAIANTNAETAFSKTISIPAGLLNVAGCQCELDFGGIYSTTGAPTVIIKVKDGTNILYQSPTLTAASGITNAGWGGKIILKTRTAGASGVLQTGLAFSGLYSTAAAPIAMSSTGPATTLDLTAARTISVTWTWGTASLSNTVTMQDFNGRAMYALATTA